jgi:hypothetical protein
VERADESGMQHKRDDDCRRQVSLHVNPSASGSDQYSHRAPTSYVRPGMEYQPP